MGVSMAAKRRHWKEKDGRYWARIAIPTELKPFFDNKTQLTEALGGDLRIADENHPAAVARLKEKIRAAQRMLEPANAEVAEKSVAAVNKIPSRPMTPEDIEQAVWAHYTSKLEEDAAKRAAMPSEQELAEELEKANRRIEAGDADPSKSLSGFYNIYTDYELKAGARYFDERLRKGKLKALRAEINTGSTRLVDAVVQEFVVRNNLNVIAHSKEWRDLAHKLMRAEMEALERTCEFDRGIFGGAPKDEIVRPPAKVIEDANPVSLQALFDDYIARKQKVGKHMDGGANWAVPIRSLIDFVGHDDARRIKHEDLVRWRDFLEAAGKSPKTIRDKYLVAIRAVLTRAVKERRLPSNEMADVGQEVPKKIRTRESGFTTQEAVRILKASLNYMPRETTHPSHRESAHITAAKRWVPLLCAFTGSRPSEITQLRKQDVRREKKRWIMRITPEAGSVKTGEFRDVPLHDQVVERRGIHRFCRGGERRAALSSSNGPTKDAGQRAKHGGSSFGVAARIESGSRGRSAALRLAAPVQDTGPRIRNVGPGP